MIEKFVANWQEVAKSVPVGCYEPLTANFSGKDFEVARFSRYQEDTDSWSPCLQTRAHDFDMRVGTFMRSTVMLGLPRVITVRGVPSFFIEPGATAREWLAQVEGVSFEQILRVQLEGTIGQHFAKMITRPERKMNERLNGMIRALKATIADIEADKAVMTARIEELQRTLARRAADE